MRLLVLPSVALIATAILFQCGYADYWFHVGTSFYNNPTNSLSNGSCCDTSCLDRLMTTQCCTNDSCNLATRICFREADQPHCDIPEGECTRGEFTYPYLPDVVNSRSMIPVRGSLINAEIQLYIRISHIPAGSQLNFALPLSNPVIDEFYYDGSVVPIVDVIPLTGEHSIAQIIVQMFYRCAINFYGSSCATYCQERDDDRGHYSCASDGSRLCLDGYTDPTTNCTKPKEQEDGTKAGQDFQNLTEMENMTAICVQSNEPTMTRSALESGKERELLSVADIVLIVNSGVLDVLLLVGGVLLAVTIAKMTHRHRRSRQGDKSTVLQNGNGHAIQQHCNTNLVIQRAREDTLVPGHVDSTYERITNYIV